MHKKKDVSPYQIIIIEFITGILLAIGFKEGVRARDKGVTVFFAKAICGVTSEVNP